MNKFGPQTPATLQIHVPGVEQQDIGAALNELVYKGKVVYDSSSSKYLLPTAKPLTFNATPEAIENKTIAKQSGSSKQITLTVSSAMYQALRKYARLQETSIEAEAQHLLAETIRMYQHSNVIPT